MFWKQKGGEAIKNWGGGDLSEPRLNFSAGGEGGGGLRERGEGSSALSTRVRNMGLGPSQKDDDEGGKPGDFQFLGGKCSKERGQGCLQASRGGCGNGPKRYIALAVSCHSGKKGKRDVLTSTTRADGSQKECRGILWTKGYG